MRESPPFREERVEWDRVIPWKERILRRSFGHFQVHAGRSQLDELESFTEAPEQVPWLSDWSLFAALRDREGGAPWWSWDADLAKREPSALARARRELAAEVDFQVYAQFLFFRQWERVRREAGKRGIAVMGDLPDLRVAGQRRCLGATASSSSSTRKGAPWRSRACRRTTSRATGQLWGNPLYRWDRMEADGFAWWIARLRANLRLCDLLRIDHFRGLRGVLVGPGRRDDGA